jgi:hypothetical protein
MQVRIDAHKKLSINAKVGLEEAEQRLDEDDKRFFKLFTESTFEGSQAAAKNIKKFVERHTYQEQQFLLLYSLYYLIRCSNSEMLSWPSSPFLVLLQLVDPNMLLGNMEASATPLRHLADLADLSNYSTHVNQLILAKQLIEHGANVNQVSIPKECTPLHYACSSFNVTNLDFIELLLEAGADPNAQDHQGMTPLMMTTMFAPGAANFLLKWPTTDVNFTTRSGAFFLARVRWTIKAFSNEVALPDNPKQVQYQLLLQQWRGIEEMLVERGAIDTGITDFVYRTLSHAIRRQIRAHAVFGE